MWKTLTTKNTKTEKEKKAYKLKKEDLSLKVINVQAFTRLFWGHVQNKGHINF